MLRLLVILLVVYALVAAMLYIFQRKLMYFPEKAELLPQIFGLNGFERVIFATQDNLTVTGFYRPPEGDKKTIVYFHGNAGHIGYRASKLTAFAKRGFGVMAVSYRGYGDSFGSPSEAGIYSDARASIDYLLAIKNLIQDQLVFYGESLGSGVAIQMATEYEPALIVLEAPYTSVVARAQEIYRIFPARFILKDRFDSVSKLPKLKAPLLVFQGEKDVVIPPHHARALLDTYKLRKKGVFYPDIDHVSFAPEILAEEIEAFLDGDNH